MEVAVLSLKQARLGVEGAEHSLNLEISMLLRVCCCTVPLQSRAGCDKRSGSHMSAFDLQTWSVDASTSIVNRELASAVCERQIEERPVRWGFERRERGRSGGCAC